MPRPRLEINLNPWFAVRYCLPLRLILVSQVKCLLTAGFAFPFIDQDEKFTGFARRWTNFQQWDSVASVAWFGNLTTPSFSPK